MGLTGIRSSLDPSVQKERTLKQRIWELEAALKAALDILGHPDDATVQAIRDVLDRKTP
jgi:hypothetical protein